MRFGHATFFLHLLAVRGVRHSMRFLWPFLCEAKSLGPQLSPVSKRNQCHLCAHAPDLGHESISNGWTGLYCGCIAGATGDAFAPKTNSMWHHLCYQQCFFLPRRSWGPTKSNACVYWVCLRIQEVVFHRPLRRPAEVQKGCTACIKSVRSKSWKNNERTCPKSNINQWKHSSWVSVGG